MRKLVRHRIPDLMVVDAGRFSQPTRVERSRLLRRKLFEEVSEYLESDDPDELLDIVEVCYALGEDHGWTPKVFADQAEDKIQRRGHLRRPGTMWIVGEP